MSIVLETSKISRMNALKDHAGLETEEPVVTQWNLAVSIKLPLATGTVTFDSKNEE